MKFIFKITLISLLVAFTGYILNVYALKNKIDFYSGDIRKSLLWDGEVEKYTYALMGDSVFCSYYVDDIKDTLWSKFEKYSGKACFPGALNASRIDDIYDAARYLSENMKPGSTVFIDIIPTRFISYSDKYGHRRTYEKEFSLLNGRFIDILEPKVSLFYPKLIESKIRGESKKNNNLNKPHKNQFNRVWDVDGDFALNRFVKFLTKIPDTYELSDEISYVKKINKIFKSKEIHPVFVLTPLNKKLIEKYAEPSQRKKILLGLDSINTKTVLYLKKNHIGYINLYDSTPNKCFADMVHTNTCGDNIIAKKLADYVKVNKSQLGE